jgi:hypothetical protein
MVGKFLGGQNYTSCGVILNATYHHVDSSNGYCEFCSGIYIFNFVHHTGSWDVCLGWVVGYGSVRGSIKTLGMSGVALHTRTRAVQHLWLANRDFSNLLFNLISH